MTHATVSRTDTARINDHFKKCKANQEPYVVCKLEHKKATVEFDFITFDHEREAKLTGSADEILQGAFDIYKKYANKRSSFTGTDMVMFMRNLEAADAEQAATELFAIISKKVSSPTPDLKA